MIAGQSPSEHTMLTVVSEAQGTRVGLTAE